MDTFLGMAFQSQEQILFFFAAILFSVSVILHLLSIEEERYSPQNDRIEQVGLKLLPVFAGLFLLIPTNHVDSLTRTVRAAQTRRRPPTGEAGSSRPSWS